MSVVCVTFLEFCISKAFAPPAFGTQNNSCPPVLRFTNTCWLHINIFSASLGILLTVGASACKEERREASLPTSIPSAFLVGNCARYPYQTLENRLLFMLLIAEPWNGDRHHRGGQLLIKLFTFSFDSSGPRRTLETANTVLPLVHPNKLHQWCVVYFRTERMTSNMTRNIICST